MEKNKSLELDEKPVNERDAVDETRLKGRETEDKTGDRTFRRDGAKGVVVEMVSFVRSQGMGSGGVHS